MIPSIDWRLLSLPIVLAAASGCGKATAPLSNLVVAASVSAPVFRVDDSVVVTVTVRNTGDVVRTIETNLCPPFIVTTADGTIVGPAEQLCTAISKPRSLRPGDEYQFTQPWAGSGRSTGGAVLPAPGTYVVRGAIAESNVENSTATIEVLP